MTGWELKRKKITAWICVCTSEKVANRILSHYKGLLVMGKFKAPNSLVARDGHHGLVGVLIARNWDNKNPRL